MNRFSRGTQYASYCGFSIVRRISSASSGRHHLIRVQQQNPVARALADRNRLLLRMPAKIAIKRVLRPERLRNLRRPVHRPRVDNHNLIRPLHRLKRPGQILLLVRSQSSRPRALLASFEIPHFYHLLRTIQTQLPCSGERHVAYGSLQCFVQPCIPASKLRRSRRGSARATLSGKSG